MEELGAKIDLSSTLKASDAEFVARSTIDIQVAERTVLLGYELPDWVGDAVSVVSFGAKILSIYQQARFQKAMFERFDAIEERLANIEASVELLHGKVDHLIRRSKLLERLVAGTPLATAFTEASGFTTLWRNQKKWTDSEIVASFGDFQLAFAAMLGDPESGWLAANFHKTPAMLTCYLSQLPTYIRALLKGGDAATFESRVERKYAEELETLRNIYGEVEDGLVQSSASATRDFIAAWDRDNTAKDRFGLSHASKLTAGWEKRSVPSNISRRARVNDEVFLRKLSRHDIHFHFRKHYVPKRDKGYFRGYHWIEFDKRTGQFRSKRIFFFPEKSIELRSRAPTGEHPGRPDLRTQGPRERPLADWAADFNWSQATKHNRAHARRWRRGRFKQTVEGRVSEINEALQRFVLIEFHRELARRSIHTIEEAKTRMLQP